MVWYDGRRFYWARQQRYPTKISLGSQKMQCAYNAKVTNK